MKRILFFSLTYHPFIGGAEIAIKESTDRINPKDYAFDMITLRFDSSLPKFERIGNVDVFRIGFTTSDATMASLKRFPLVLNKYLYPFLALAAAITLHRRKPYDAVCSVMTSYSSFAALFFKMVFPSVPYIVRSDDGDPIGYLKRRVGILYPLFVRIFTKADSAITTSSYLEKFVRSMGYSGPLAIVPNGVDLTRFTEVSHPSFVAGGTVNLVTASRLVHKNALDEVIRALVLLPKNVQFVIYGTGPDEMNLRKLSEELGVSDRVLFKGYIPHTELAQAFSNAHIFIRPSRSEGMGMSFVEAMAAGLPVIATQEGGIVDFLFDEKRNPDKPTTGWAVDVDSPEQIAVAVKDIITNPEKITRVRENGLKLVRSTYDWNLIGQQMKSVFDRVFENG
jgi:glycosyltransferase involved in cell wall biosynthesis